MVEMFNYFSSVANFLWGSLIFEHIELQKATSVKVKCVAGDLQFLYNRTEARQQQLPC